jgi:hypothetical protein
MQANIAVQHLGQACGSKLPVTSIAELAIKAHSPFERVDHAGNWLQQEVWWSRRWSAA